jgi:ankyrin repeat protein
VTEQLKNKITDLMIAASRGDLAEACRLIEAGEDINGSDIFGNTPLIYAAMSGHAEMVELLLQNGAYTQKKNKRGLDCLESARERGQRQIEGILRGAQLLLLIRDGEIARSTELLEMGLDVNLQIMGGWTPLMVAALENQLEIVKLLLDRNANLEAQNSQGLTAETIAFRKGHSRIGELLRSKRAGLPLTQAPEEEEPNILDLDDLSPATTSIDESEALN